MRYDDPVLDHIESIIVPTLTDMGFSLVQLKFVSGTKKTLQILAEDSNGQMNIDECANLSRAVSAILDVEDAIDGEYLLEVSSPGLDRPLNSAEDFARFAGFTAKIRLDEGVSGRKNFKGKIVAANNENVSIKIGDEQGEENAQLFELPLDQISAARLVVTEELIRHDLKKAKSS